MARFGLRDAEKRLRNVEQIVDGEDQATPGGRQHIRRPRDAEEAEQEHAGFAAPIPQNRDDDHGLKEGYGDRGPMLHGTAEALRTHIKKERMYHTC